MTERAKHGGKYYIFSDEVRLVAECLSAILTFVPAGTAFIDFGPGSEEAIGDKPGAILRAADGRIDEYIAVDFVFEILKNAQAYFAEFFPKVRFSGVQGDMYGALELPKRRPRVAAVFGQTIFNVAVNPFDAAAANEKEIGLLRALKNHLDEGEKILIPQNCSEDRKIIEAAYWEQEQVWLNMFHRVERDLRPAGNYDPDGFAFEPYWISASNILSHSAVATKAMNFELGGEEFSLSSGDRWFLHNTLVYPVRTFEEIAEAAGLNGCYKKVNAEKRMAFHIFEAGG
jgi:uncharacterized SAM-dependent methyltransferase